MSAGWRSSAFMPFQSLKGTPHLCRIPFDEARRNAEMRIKGPIANTFRMLLPASLKSRGFDDHTSWPKDLELIGGVKNGSPTPIISFIDDTANFQ